MAGRQSEITETGAGAFPAASGALPRTTDPFPPTVLDLDAPATPVRRAPFSDNPTLGIRGLRTQQRILDAALTVFDEHGYDRTALEQIAQVAGCSRASIYQYFSGKEDVFRHLSGTVAHLLGASTTALDPVTADGAGLAALRGWVDRYATVHTRYEPVFRGFTAAASTDPELMGGAMAVAERNIAIFLARIDGPALPPRALERVTRLLHAGIGRTFELASILRSVAPEVYSHERVDAAVAAVMHRCLFGLDVDVNGAAGRGPRPPATRLGPEFRAIYDRWQALEREADQPGRRALASLLAAGDEVVVSNGYQGTRVDHVVAAASVSRGAFYRYFANIDDFVRVVALRAGAEISAVVAQIPDGHDRAALRRWLRRYREVQSANDAQISVFSEAIEVTLRDERAGVIDWGRRRMATLVAGRDFGDDDVDALVLLAMVSGFGSSIDETIDVEAAMIVVERGFLGRTNGGPP